METIAGVKTPGLCLVEALPAEVVALGISICDTTRDGSRMVGYSEVIGATGLRGITSGLPSSFEELKKSLLPRAPIALPGGHERLPRKYACGVVPSIVRNILFLPACTASVASSSVRSVILTDERFLHFQLRQDTFKRIVLPCSFQSLVRRSPRDHVVATTFGVPADACSSVYPLCTRIR